MSSPKPPQVDLSPEEGEQIERAGERLARAFDTHNAGRSQIAAGWMRHLAGDRVEVFTGGTEPAGALNRVVVDAMAEVGIDLSEGLPQPWTGEVALAADVIVTMGCGDACPVFEGKRYEDWDLSSPSDASLEEVRELRDEVRARVEALLGSLFAASAGGRR